MAAVQPFWFLTGRCRCPCQPSLSRVRSGERLHVWEEVGCLEAVGREDDLSAASRGSLLSGAEQTAGDACVAPRFVHPEGNGLHQHHPKCGRWAQHKSDRQNLETPGRSGFAWLALSPPKGHWSGPCWRRSQLYGWSSESIVTHGPTLNDSLVVSVFLNLV